MAPPLLNVDQAHGPFQFVLREVGPGTTSWEYTVDPAHFNPHGVLHGGVLMGLLDTAMGHAVSEMVVPQGRINAAAQFNIHFLVPIRSGTILAKGTVIKLGKRMAVVEGRASDEAGVLVGLATSTHALLP
jgi:uncharacterized protein (TIGR00369 family)